MTKATSRRLATAALAVLTLAIGPLPARAQFGVLRSNIPFGFYVGGQEFPPGEYTVERSVGNLVHLADREGHTLLTFALPAIRQPEKSAKLIFNKYGAEYFLSEIDWKESSTALEFPPSSHERELAKKTVPQRVVSTDKR